LFKPPKIFLLPNFEDWRSKLEKKVHYLRPQRFCYQLWSIWINMYWNFLVELTFLCVFKKQITRTIKKSGQNARTCIQKVQILIEIEKLGEWQRAKAVTARPWRSRQLWAVYSSEREREERGERETIGYPLLICFCKIGL